MLCPVFLVPSIWSTYPLTMADDAAATTAASTRPQKPDEAAFKETVAKLEKEHTQVKNQLVCQICPTLHSLCILEAFDTFQLASTRIQFSPHC